MSDQSRNRHLRESRKKGKREEITEERRTPVKGELEYPTEKREQTKEKRSYPAINAKRK